MRSIAAASVAALIAFASQLSAQCPLGDVFPSDGQASDEFGSVLAVDGDWMVVGAPSADRGGNEQGASYIFERDGAGGWTEYQVLESSEPDDLDRFGWSVAVEGNLMVISVLGDDDFAFDNGAAYVFEFDGVSWKETQKLLASNGGLGDLFGISVAISDERIVIGACQRSRFELFGIGEGMVYVFERVGMAFVEDAVLTASDRQAGDFFGAGVAVDGDRIVVGAEAEDQVATDAGALYVFDLVGSTWTERAKVTASDGGTGDFLGMRVRVDGDRIAAGAPTADVGGTTDAGAVYVFDGSGGGTLWNEVLKIVDPSPDAGDMVGMGLDFEGDLIAAGGPGAGSGDAGRLQLYRDDSAGLVLVASFDGASGSDEFGWSAALDGDTLLIGARSEASAGAAHEFLHVRASVSARNAGSNPNSLTLGLPQLGTTVVATVDLVGTSGHSMAGLVAYASGTNFLLTGGQVLLVNTLAPGGELIGGPIAPGPIASFPLLVPASTALCGATVSLQALHFGGSAFELSNALDVVIGS